MKFLYPEFLWAFAVLLIPILIHLFNFKRYKTHYFSSLQFVKHVDLQTKSTQKLKHLLVLLARLLAFACAVLAFAQPYFPNSEAEALKKESIVMIYLDNSFSMQARGVEGELLSSAKETAQSIVEKAPKGTQFIVGTNEMSGIEQRRINRIDALDKIDKIEYSPLTRSLDDIIDWKQKTIKKIDIDENESFVQSVILSDFQQHASTKKEKLNLNSFEFHPVQLIPEETANIFIDSVWFSSPIRKVGEKHELNIRLFNDSDQDLKNVEVTVKVDRFNKLFYTDIPANGKKETSLTYSDKSVGWKSGKVTVADEHVIFDDTYYLSYEVKEHANVLVLNGEDAIRNVRVVLDLEDYYLVEENKISAITLDNFKNKDLVIINGANALSSGVINYLTEFNENGGALSLFPGKNPDKSAWNQLLGKLKLPLMGAKISSGTLIKSLNYDDPFIRDVISSKSERLNLPSVVSSYQPMVVGSSNYKTLITMQNGLPLLAYSKPNGTAYMFYSSIHPDFGVFASDALFSTCVLRMSELSQRGQPIALTIGDESSYPVYADNIGEEVIHLSKDKLDFIPQKYSRSGITYISLSQFDKFEQLFAGNYSIDGEKNLGTLSLNYHRKESKLKYLSELEIKNQFTERGASNVVFTAIDGVNSPIGDLSIDKPFSYWKLFLILTLIFVITEMLLVRFWKS
jgi:hypothetical protein